jgi:ABC-type polysaccharide/polyol phosphate transport system ATPase subunit
VTTIHRDRIIPGQPLVELRHVSRSFDKHRNRARSLQERFIRTFTRQKPEYDRFWPLQDVSFAVSQGECVGVIGPNGSGKSTLLKVVAGILPPTSGDMAVRGRVCSLLELGAGFHPDLTGRENIYLNGSIYGLRRADIDRRMDQIIGYAELGEFIDTQVKHYSSGMYVRLGFAVAIHTDPDLLLVDEVLAVGDANFQHKCMNSVFSFRERGGTLLFVSHDLATIQRICSSVIWLEDGYIQAMGQPVDVVMAYTEHMARKEATSEGRATTTAEAHRWGSGKVRIDRVQICDPGGEEVHQFSAGQPMTVRLHFTATAEISRPVFGLAIYSKSGVHITGPNTEFSGLDLSEPPRAGILEYRVPALPLLAGDYLLSVAAVAHNDAETYDYHDRLYSFQVVAGRPGDRYGLVSLGGGWQLAATRADVASRPHYTGATSGRGIDS